VSEPERLEVALLNFAYWPEVRRGNERLVHDLAQELVRRADGATIITSHPHRRSRTVEDGVCVVRSRRPPEGVLRLRGIQERLSHVPFSYRELRRRAFDLAHAFFLTDAVASTRWATRTGGPAVFSLTGVPERANVSNLRLRRRLLELAVERSDAVVVLSCAAREATWRWLGVEARVIHPGVDLARFRPGARSPVPTLACAAAPEDARKRVELLVRAFELVRRDRPDAELLLLRPDDPALARRLGEPRGVRLLAPTADAVSKMLATAWGSALCSRNEAFGLVLVESLASGTPAVGANDGAIPEIIDRPEVGRLFEGDDERAVARALLEVLELAESPSTVAACRSRAESFSAKRTGEAHRALYRELLRR